MTTSSQARNSSAKVKQKNAEKGAKGGTYQGKVAVIMPY